jgi:hypothetical protein
MEVLHRLEPDHLRRPVGAGKTEPGRGGDRANRSIQIVAVEGDRRSTRQGPGRSVFRSPTVASRRTAGAREVSQHQDPEGLRRLPDGHGLLRLLPGLARGIGSQLDPDAVADAGRVAARLWSPRWTLGGREFSNLATKANIRPTSGFPVLGGRTDFLCRCLDSAALAAPSRDWLLDALESVTGERGPRQVGMKQVDGIREMFALFQEMDVMRGGGHARTALAQYMTSYVLPPARRDDHQDE